MTDKLQTVKEALEEIVILIADIRSGDYKPDSFTIQPIQQALAELNSYIEARDSVNCTAQSFVTMIEDSGTDLTHVEEYVKLEAAIKAMEGGE